MKSLVLTSLIAVAFPSGQALAEDDLDLEPSINGEVSASGMYPTQEEEDQALALLSEACIYGEQAPSSLYTAKIRQNMERARRIAQGIEEGGEKVATSRCVVY